MSFTPGNPPRAASWRTYLGLLGSPLVVVALVAILAMGAVQLLGGVRGYVVGESLWSKARSEAVLNLLHYARTGDDADLQRFQSALKIPRADRLARQAMDRPKPRVDLARRWLIEGGNHPAIVDSMVMLYRLAGDRWVMRDALDAWQRGDELIEQLERLAGELHAAVQRQDRMAVDRLTEELYALNEALDQAGLRFTQVLADAARVTERALMLGLAIAAMLLSLVSMLQVRQVLIKRAHHQHALKQSHRRWELASAAAGLGLYELHKATGEVRLDDKAAHLHGLSGQPMPLTREALIATVVPEDRDRIRAQTEAALSGGSDHKIRYRVQAFPGVTRAVEVTGSLVDAETPASARLLGVVRDVTDEVNQAELAMKRDAAERVAQAQREFLSRLSHELRTPLNAILGFAQLMRLESSPATPTSHVRKVDLILTAGQQLLALIEDVLDMSKVESGHIDIQCKPVDAIPIIRSCVGLVDGQLQRQQLTLIDALPAQPMWVHADPQRLHQVFTNLLTNACKYNRTGGRVTLMAQSQGDQAHISIADTGIGMSPADQQELFQPFKRLNPAPHIEGTGLGLYIVKMLVQRMGGDITVQSVPGQGSQFTVRLAAVNAAEPASSEPAL